MVATCEDDLICDMAETYHIMNWRELPLRQAATLASGLHRDSRTMLRLSGERTPFETLLQAAVLDQLRILSWQHLSVRDRKKLGPPPSVLEVLQTDEKKTQLTGFDSPEEFEMRRKQILGGG